MNPSVVGTSDSQGIIRIPAMMPGPFNFGMIGAEGYARWWSDACKSEWTRGQQADRFGFQRNFDGLDFDMKPGMPAVTIRAEKAATVRGRVLDPSGKPVAGATVAPALTGSGNSLTGDTRFSVETDRNGAFTMRLPASGEIAYNLVAHDGKFQEWRTWANGILAPFQTKPGEVMENVTLSLTRPATVRGRVVNDAGQPVAGREVRASAADKMENRYYDPTTTTRADGTFELRFIRPGEQHIQVEPFWLYATDAPTASSRTFTLAEGQTKTGVELDSSPRAAETPLPASLSARRGGAVGHNAPSRFHRQSRDAQRVSRPNASRFHARLFPFGPLISEGRPLKHWLEERAWVG